MSLSDLADGDYTFAASATDAAGNVDDTPDMREFTVSTAPDPADRIVARDHNCAIVQSGKVFCWGLNTAGQLGLGHTERIGDNENPGAGGPVDLGAGRSAISITGGWSHTCALLDNGRVRCWGSGTSGMLGQGNVDPIGDNETPGSVEPVQLGGDVVSLNGNGSHTCALLENGDVRCWGWQGGALELGHGSVGNIGDNEVPASLPPVNFGPGRYAEQISTGNGHTCAILDDGSLRCFGSNGSGELGTGTSPAITNPAQAKPVDLGAGHTATSVSAGIGYSCAVRDDGALLCWGNATDGHLGYGNLNTTGDNETPGSVGPVDLGAGRTATQVVAGYKHTCALLDDGSTRCWGFNPWGQLGLGLGHGDSIGDNEPPASVPAVNVGFGRTSIAISADGTHTCAVLDNEDVRCWGLNSGSHPGVLGYLPTVAGTVGRTQSPGSMPPLDLVDDAPLAVDDVRAHVKNGSPKTLLVLANDTDVDAGPMRAVATSAASHGVAEIGEAGTTLTYSPEAGYCGSDTFSYTLNGGSTANVRMNVRCDSSGDYALTDGDRFASLLNHNCLIRANDEVMCWGSGGLYALGSGTHNQNVGDNESPGSEGPVSLGAGREPAAVSVGEGHSCALLEDGRALCWGSNWGAELGTGNQTPYSTTSKPSGIPTVDFGPGRTAVELDVGGRHTCAISDNAEVRCWGANSNYQTGYTFSSTIGFNQTVGSLPALPLPADMKPLELAAASAHTCVLFDNGEVRCFGSAANGRLGTGSTANAQGAQNARAIDFGPGRSAVSIDAGYNHTCAILDNGGVSCWGLGSSGQLGYASTQDIGDNETPGSAGHVNLGGRTAVDIELGFRHTCAVLNDQSTRCWGQGSTGALGYANSNSVGDNESPSTGSVNVGEGRHSVALALGNDYTCALLDNDDVRCFGSSPYGALGYYGKLSTSPNESPSLLAPVPLVDIPPVAVNDSGYAVTEDVARALVVGHNDTNPDGGARFIQSVTQPAHGSAEITDATAIWAPGILYTPAPNYCGPDSFTYALNGGSTATVSFNVQCVNDPPVAVNDSKTISEDAGASQINVLANDTDVDSGTKTVASKTDGTHGSVAITNGGLDVSYTPNADYCGDDTFTYTLAGDSTATVTVTVECVDDAPNANDDQVTLSEDGNADFDVLANDGDIDGGERAVASKTEPAHGQLRSAAGGTGITYTPNPDYCGSDSFDYTLNGGSTGTVNLTVECVDDAPSAVGDSRSLAEDSSSEIQVLANDANADGGEMTITAAGAAAHGGAAITGNSITYTANPNYCGPDAFTYTLNGGSQATVSITVGCVDDAPGATNDSLALAEDAAATEVGVLANDTDIDAGPKQVISKQAGTHGTVEITGSGSDVRYTPNANYCGADSFTYTLNGGSQATVSVTVGCVEDSPTATGDTKTVAEDSPAAQIDVLGNDSDPDGGEKTIVAVGSAAHGVTAMVGGSAVSYTPNANYCGSDSFGYTLNGGSSATVAIAVSCVDDAPSATGDSKTVTWAQEPTRSTCSPTTRTPTAALSRSRRRPTASKATSRSPAAAPASPTRPAPAPVAPIPLPTP